jgi:predicted thioesterase
MEIGAKFKVTIKVEEKDTAMAHGSGTLAVLATPRMIALMEESAYKCIDKYLEEGQSSVGTYLDVKHLAATPVGMDVYAESEVIEIDGRRVVFSVKAYDEKGLIGEGKHERFIVFSEKFVAKTYQKLDK